MAWLTSGAGGGFASGYDFRGQGTTSFQRLLKGNVMLNGMGHSKDFSRLLQKSYKPPDMTGGQASRAAAQAKKQFAKALLKKALKQGVSPNPFLKLALEIADQIGNGGEGGYQIHQKTYWDGTNTWGFGPTDTEAYTNPFPTPSYGSININNPNVYSIIYLPWHETLHQYRYERLVGPNPFNQYFYFYSKGIQAGVGSRAGPGYNWGLGGFNHKQRKVSLAGKYRWLREQDVAIDPDKTSTGFLIGKSGPPKMVSGRGRPRGPESKAQLSVSGYRYILGMANALGEAYEWIDMLAAASGWKYDPAVGGTRLYNKFVWLFFQGGLEKIDWNKLHDERLANEVEDFIFGQAGRLSKGGARGIGRMVGLQLGLAM